MSGKKTKIFSQAQKMPKIGESVNISISIQLEKFLKDDNETELKFSSFLSVQERAFIHKRVANLGLKSKSRGRGVHRFITVYKREGSTLVQSDARLSLQPHSRQLIADMLEAHPITAREKDELNGCAERERAPAHKSAGFLNSGAPQIPPAAILHPDLAAFKRDLPVYAHRHRIVSTIRDHQAVVIVGETGSGKTTQIPQYILEQCQLEGTACRIVCTQPRRISAVAVAERVAYERNEKIGHSIGYQIRLESRVSPRTVLTYCTNGVLLRTLMGGGSALTSITHVLVDEVHERDKFSDFLLISLKEALAKFRDLRVVLMSATIDAQIFSRYFNGCPILSIPGRLFDVKKFYLEDVLEMTNYQSEEMKSALKAFKLKQIEKHPTQSTLTDINRDKNFIPITESIIHEESVKKGVVDPEIQADIDEFLSDCLNDGSLDSFAQILYMYVSEGVPVNSRHSRIGLTGLMAAAHHGLTDTVRQIIHMGGDTTIMDAVGRTAADYAQLSDRRDCADFLLTSNFRSVSSATETTQVSTLAPLPNPHLEVYLQSVDEDAVDHCLLLALIRHIHLTQPEGGILVFLPGYDDIVTLRSLIQACEEIAHAEYRLFTLHSNMNTADQKRVFQRSPGVRKIIVSTNIAETSITVDDVAYVVDSGKAKEMYFESQGGVCSLQVVWISKACSAQRAGRAGRSRPGSCYLLCSRRRYEALPPVSVPEILRVPLHDLCLNTKHLAPGNTPIADFLGKALEPPSFLAVRNAVGLLKTIGALTPVEDLTEIGQHLLDLTVEPKLGKMLLYACALKCLDPVLTVVCALAHKEPFQIGADPEARKRGSQARRSFAADSFSDHMALLRAFQAWQQARASDSDRTFCQRNSISGATMEMIVGLRSQLLAQLRAAGLVKARGPGDMKDCNLNSDKWAVVKAALTSGLYPSVARVDREDAALRTSKEVRLGFHPSSTLHSPGGGRAGTRRSVEALPTDWLVYEEISRVGRFCFVRCATSVTALAVALFGGPLRLGPSALRSGAPGLSEDEDSEEDDRFGDSAARGSCLALDDWVAFAADDRDALAVYSLRQKFAAMMIRRMLHPTKVTGQAEDRIVATVAHVLVAEERRAGLAQPAGVGQRPRPALADRNSPRAAKSPPLIRSPPPTGSSPGEITATTVADARYFIIKANNPKAIETSQHIGKWNFITGTEKKLTRISQSGCRVFLFFSIAGAISKFLGCAEFLNEPCESDLSRSIRWISSQPLAHHATRHLLNGLNENRRVSSAKDGQEMCGASGEALLSLLDQLGKKRSNNGRPIQKQTN